MARLAFVSRSSPLLVTHRPPHASNELPSMWGIIIPLFYASLGLHDSGVEQWPFGFFTA